MIAFYNLILGASLLAVGVWMVRSERRRDMAIGLACVIVSTTLLLNALLEIVWPMP